MRLLAAALSCFAALAPPCLAADAPVRVLIVGTYHFGNPGRDQHNVESDDVLKPERQAQLAAIDAALAKFAPTRVAVEWPKEIVDERYAKFLAGTLEPSRNEVVQLGFRAAKTAKLDHVDGIDAEGEFPYEPVDTWATKHGMKARLDAAGAETEKRVAAITKQQAEGTIGETLRAMNRPESIAADAAWYADLLRYGAGDEQPGADLLAAWGKRNLLICARLVQAAKPGDRVLVFYGAGHAHLLRQCVGEVPGFELVEPNAYL